MLIFSHPPALVELFLWSSIFLIYVGVFLLIFGFLIRRYFDKWVCLDYLGGIASAEMLFSRQAKLGLSVNANGTQMLAMPTDAIVLGSTFCLNRETELVVFRILRNLHTYFFDLSLKQDRNSGWVFAPSRL